MSSVKSFPTGSRVQLCPSRLKEYDPGYAEFDGCQAVVKTPWAQSNPAHARIKIAGKGRKGEFEIPVEALKAL